MNYKTSMATKTKTFPKKNRSASPQVGSCYLFHTVLGIWLGSVEAIGDTHALLDRCSWVADQGRMGISVRDGNYNEAEFLGDGVMVPLDAIIVPWRHALPGGDK